MVAHAIHVHNCAYMYDVNQISFEFGIFTNERQASDVPLQWTDLTVMEEGGGKGEGTV